MDAKSKPRRRHSAQFKAGVIAACAEPGASVAAVARRFDLNDNLVHQWRRGRGSGAGAGTTSVSHRAAEFVALSLPAPASSPPTTPAASSLDIRIEFKRGSTTVGVSWPVTAAGECGAWLRELLR